MGTLRLPGILVVLLVLPLGHIDAAESAKPYAGLETRTVKALSEDETEGLLAGKGLSMALPAELNGYPGPRHVLDLGESLRLDADQYRHAEATFQTMQSRAQALGAQIVDKETALDRLFAAGTADAAAVRTLTDEIGRLRGALRAVHLEAHLAMRAILTPAQVSQYATLRGYGAGGREHHGSGHGAMGHVGGHGDAGGHRHTDH